MFEYNAVYWGVSELLKLFLFSFLQKAAVLVPPAETIKFIGKVLVIKK